MIIRPLKLRVVALCSLVILSSCRKPEPTPSVTGSVAEKHRVPSFDPTLVDGNRALAEVQKLVAISPRDSGTEGGRKAADYLRRRLEELGVAVEVDEFKDKTPYGEMVFRNVLGRIPGERGERLVIIGSHYDTKVGMCEGFEGANDSGSSTGLLIELARVFKKGAAQVDILLVLFDGEECLKAYGPDDGLYGSRRLARQLTKQGMKEKMLGVIILDMIGDRDLTIGLPANNTPFLSAAILAAARQQGVREKFSLAKHAMTDDHVPFLDIGVPAADIIDFQYGSKPGLNDYWHTPEDTLDKLSAESLEIVGRVVVCLVNSL